MLLGLTSGTRDYRCWIASSKQFNDAAEIVFEPVEVDHGCRSESLWVPDSVTELDSSGVRAGTDEGAMLRSSLRNCSVHIPDIGNKNVIKMGIPR